MQTVIPLEPGGFYHIYNRGVNRENIFREERNFAYFLTLYARHITPIVETFAYCLLRNHFHLLVRIRTSIKTDAVFETASVSGLKTASVSGLETTLVLVPETASVYLQDRASRNNRFGLRDLSFRDQHPRFPAHLGQENNPAFVPAQPQLPFQCDRFDR